MLQNVIIGQYIPVESLLHRFDPRAKILSVFVFIFIIFLVNNWTGSAVIVSFTLFLAILSRIPFRFLYRGLKLFCGSCFSHSFCMCSLQRRESYGSPSVRSQFMKAGSHKACFCQSGYCHLSC